MPNHARSTWVELALKISGWLSVRDFHLSCVCCTAGVKASMASSRSISKTTDCGPRCTGENW
eukprot:1264062-Pyramimonas_sp.AAC.1